MVLVRIITIITYIDMLYSMNYSLRADMLKQADMLGQNCSEVVCNEIILFFQEAGLEGRSGGLIN